MRLRQYVRSFAVGRPTLMECRLTAFPSSARTVFLEPVVARMTYCSLVISVLSNAEAGRCASA